MSKPLLTIGMATYDDFDGVYFTVQSIRLHHPEVADQIEIIVIDNNPKGAHGKSLKEFAPYVPNGRLIPYTVKKGTSVRNEIFRQGRGDFVMSVDCHVLFALGSLKKLIDFFVASPNTDDLYQGPMMYDGLGLSDIATHFDPKWQAEMYGVWGHDSRADDPTVAPFEIQMQGLGMFACRRDSWLGFNASFRGFGGEEGYIHEKYRKAGRHCWCLPFLRWGHRFYRPNGVPYPVTREDKLHNYFVGWHELGLDEQPIIDHFSAVHPKETVLAIQKKAHDATAKASIRYTSDELMAVSQQLATHLVNVTKQQRDRALAATKESNPAIYILVTHHLNAMLEGTK